MIVYFAVLIFSILWLALIFAGPAMQVQFGHDSIIAQVYYIVFKQICHQIPERSYFLLGYQLPVCARCLGIYIGITFGSVLYLFFNKLDNTKLPNKNFLYIFILPIVIDGLFQTLHFYSTSNNVRFLIGLWATFGLMFFAFPILNKIVNDFKKS